jgi:heptosyltransferase-2
MTPPRKVLLVSLSNLGDAVLSLPVLDGLRQAYPEAALDVVAGERARAVFAQDPRVRKLWITERRWPLRRRLAFFFELRRERYDLAVDLRRTLWGFAARRRSPFFRPGLPVHKRDAHLEVLRRTIGGGRLDRTPSVRGPVREDASGKRPFVVIAPGSRSHTKQWPKERFAALAARLVLERGAEVAWIGDASERALAEELRAASGVPSENLAGASWEESGRLVSRAQLVVTNDSAPLHLADRLGVPVLAFFGPTDPRKYGPQGTPEGVLFRGKFCSPCERAQCRYDLECLREITVDEAYYRAVKLLDRTPSGGAGGGDTSGGRHPLSDVSPRAPYGRGPVRRPLKILAVRLDRMGDMLLTFGAFAAIRRAHPDARLTVLTRPYTADLPMRSGAVDDVLVYDYRRGGAHATPRGYARLVQELRRRAYDVAFILHPTLRSHLLCFLAGIPERVGYAARGAALLTRAVRDRRHEGLQHESRNVLEVLGAAGIAANEETAAFRVFAEDEREGGRLLEDAAVGPDYFVLHPGSDSPSKRWAPERFAALGRLLAREARVVIVGDARHAVPNAEVARAIGPACADLTGRTAAPCLAAVLRRARALVSNDSGPVHLGVLVGTPVVSIFGRNEPGLGPRRWGPLGERAATIHKNVGCLACLADDCPIGFECLKAVEPEEVFAAVRALVPDYVRQGYVGDS